MNDDGAICVWNSTVRDYDEVTSEVDFITELDKRNKWFFWTTVNQDGGRGYRARIVV